MFCQTIWQRFTGRCRLAIFRAQEVAAEFGQSSVSSEHLLIGLLRESDCSAATGLRALKINPEVVNDIVRQMLPEPAPSHAHPEMTLAPDAKRVIDLALEESKSLDDNFIGTEHLLLGLLLEGNGIANRALRAAGAEAELIRKAVVDVRRGEKGGIDAKDRQLWALDITPLHRVTPRSGCVKSGSVYPCRSLSLAVNLLLGI